MIEIFTIGFTGKSAEKFFNLLKTNGVTQIVDTRINTGGQLSGYAKTPDLAFFAKEIGKIGYRHELDFAPELEMMRNYRDKKLTWDEYKFEYLNLLDLRKIGQKISPEELHGHCLLCSEHKPEKCHRRLLAEYLAQRHNNLKITHLVD